MDELLIHPRSRAELTALASDPPHAVLLVAANGTGKLTVAKTWATSVAKDASVSILSPDEKGTITIEATRSLYLRTRSKQAGWQVVIIDHAEAMGSEAQNAFLKLLEEPRARTTFILTAPNTEALLPTILSRLQVVLLQAVATQHLTDFAKKTHPELAKQELAQLLFMAHGRPATLATLLQDKAALGAYKMRMQLAKKLLGATTYERLAAVSEISKDRVALIDVLDAMAYMLSLQLKNQPSSDLMQFADALQECLQRLRQNGNLRAQLTHLWCGHLGR